MNHNPLLLEVDPMGIWPLGIFTISFVALNFLVLRYKEMPLYVRAAWGYAANYALIILLFPYPLFGNITTAFRMTAAQALIQLMLIPLLVVRASTFLWKLIPWAVCIELVCVWANKPGLLAAPSFDLSFCALCAPWLSPWLLFATLVTIATHHGSTALVILGVQALAFLIRDPKPTKWLLLVALSMGVALLYQKSGVLLGRAERLEHWRSYLSFWAQNPRDILLGFGTGSFMWLSLLIDKFTPPMFLHMHSDWLQILFEQGVAGFLLCMGVVVGAIKRAWNDPKLLGGVLGVCAFGLTYHPLRFAPSSVVVCLILNEVFKTKTALSDCSPKAAL